VYVRDIQIYNSGIWATGTGAVQFSSGTNKLKYKNNHQLWISVKFEDWLNVILLANMIIFSEQRELRAERELMEVKEW
jgi:hypothetical protein